MESRVAEHPSRIGAELEGRQVPGSPLSAALLEAMERDEALVRDVKGFTSFGADVMRAEGMSDGLNTACAVACFLCSLGSFAACVACAICPELPPSGGDPPPITVLSE